MERERDQENDVKTSILFTIFKYIFWYLEMKFDKESTHHDRRPLHLNYD